MEYLPSELTIDILSRLSVKTIIHCKCVCKKWRNLVMDSSFVDLHLSRSHTGLIIHHKPIIWNVINDLGVLEWVEIEDNQHLLHDPLMSIRLNITPILQNSVINTKGSVNGLICLWQYNRYLDNTYICNPITREYMILSSHKYSRKGKRFIGGDLRPRGPQETVVYGFGVNSLTGEYKVVRTFQGDIPSNGYISEAEVYTLGTGQWRSLGHVPYRLYEFYGSYGPFLNNHCHWIVSDKEDAPEKLCTFDLDKEIFQLFPSPPSPLEEAIHGSPYDLECLAILKGCLCKMDSYYSQFTIWVMKEYGIKKSWHKEVVIKQAIRRDPDWLFRKPMYLIECLKDGSILTVSENKLWAFQPKSETIEDTGLFDFSFCLSGLAFRPSFLKLQNFESERVHIF